MKTGKELNLSLFCFSKPNFVFVFSLEQGKDMKISNSYK